MRPGSHSRDEVTWPDIDQLIKDASLLLVVVIPGAQEPWTGPAPNCVGAASNVYVLSGQNDPIVAEYQHFIAICSLRGQKAADAIAAEAEAKTQLERLFAEDAAVATLGPEDAVKVIGAAVEAGEKADKPNQIADDVDHGISLLFEFGLDPGPRPGAGRLPAQRMMAHIVVTSPEPYFNQMPVFWLARFISQRAKVADVVPSAADRAALAEAVRTPSKRADPAAYANVLKWLGVGN
jgi:hypothetical protein